MTRDRITLTGIRARGTHGVLAHEKRDGQDFVVDVVLHVDLVDAADTDDLEATVSYAEVAADVVARIEGPSLDLVETLAGQVADDALRRELVEAVEVTVHKPQAPVGVPFADVSVHVVRERSVPVVVALGANLGDPGRTLHEAVAELGEVLRVRAVAPFVTTDPVGGPEQPVYTNSVLVGDTALAPASLLRTLHTVEARHGRTRDVRWGPRTLDLDLIQHGDPRAGTDVRRSGEALTLPHPRAHERAFVLVPWLAAEPDAALRVGDRVVPVAELVAGLDTSGVRALGDRPGGEAAPC